MENEKKVKWKIPSQAIPIGYILLICIGYTERSIFYNNFGIDVANYLDFDEYLFIFLPITSFLLIFGLICSIYVAGLFGALTLLFNPLKGNIKKDFKDSTEIKNIPNRNKSFKKLSYFFRIIGIIVFIIVFATPFVISLLQPLAIKPTTQWILIYIVVWCFVLFVFFILRTIQIQQDMDRSRLFLLYATTIPLIILFIWQYKAMEADNILNGKSETKISFIMQGRKIITNDTILFIGQTRNYLFLRNLKSNGNLIYKKHDITEMEIIK